MTDQADYLIVGAGPAGLAAAITASELGLSVTLIDEQSAPGGQIHRNIENRTQYNHNCWPEMDEEGLKLIQAFRKSKCHYLPNTQVWQLEKNGKVYVIDGTKARCIKAKKVLMSDPFVTIDPNLVSLAAIINDSDILIIAAPHEVYKQLQTSKPVIDIWNLLGDGNLI